MENGKRPFGISLFRSLRLLLVDKDKNIRAATLRALRYLMTSDYELRLFTRAQLPLFICRSLERDPRYVWERMQALKLIRRWLEVNPKEVPRNFVQSLVAITEHAEDNFRRVCLETLRELTVRNTQLVALSGGIHVLVDAILDPSCQDVAESLLLTLLFILNEPSTRQFVRPQLEIERILSCFTDVDTPASSSDKQQRWAAGRNAIVAMMRSWTGIVCLASDQHGLRTLVEMLGQPVTVEARKAVFETLFEIFRIATPGNGPSSSSSALSSSVPPSLRSRGVKNDSIRWHNLLHNYMVMILQAFIHCNLIETLITLGLSGNGEIASLATRMLREIMALSADLLPNSPNLRLHAVPALVNAAACFDSSGLTSRVRASSMLSELNELTGSLTPWKPARHDLSDAEMRLIVEFAVFSNNGYNHSQDVMLHVLKTHMDSQMDELHFQALLKQCNVLVTKDHTKWDWDIIADIIEGPLTNPLRLGDALKTKFVKRVLGFYTPSKRAFTELDWAPENFHYVRTGCRLLQVLVKQHEGREIMCNSSAQDHFFLAGRSFIEEFVTIFRNEVEPDVSGTRVLARDRLKSKMSREYFAFLGVLSGCREGVELLQRFELFKSLNNLSNSLNRDYLSRLMVTALQYNIDGASRNLLAAWMTKGSEQLRKCATRHLRVLFRSGLSDFNEWGIELLVTQLHMEPQVAGAALAVLEEACQEPEHIKALVDKWPNIMHLGKAGTNLLVTVLSSSVGFGYLYEMDWIRPELQRWKSEECLYYVNTVESALVSGLKGSAQTSLGSSNSASPSKPIPVPMPATAFKDEAFNLAWLYRMPWSIQVVFEDSKGTILATVLADTTVESAEDCRDVNNSCPSLSDEWSALRVVGSILNSEGIPSPQGFPADVVIKACLCVGALFVDMRGSITESPDWIHCSVEDRKRLQQLSKGSSRLDKSSTIWNFVKVDDRSNVKLKSVEYRIELIPPRASTVYVPPHFYGELVKTSEGVELLRESNHFQDFTNEIKAESTPPLVRRAALWTVGHIGACDNGFVFLEETRLVPVIVSIAQESLCLSLRGTCFYVLGLLSRSKRAREVLKGLGWVSPADDMSCISVPEDVSKFFQVPAYEFSGSWPLQCANGLETEADKSEIVTPSNKDHKKITEILAAMSNLSNHVMQKAAHGALLKLRQQNGDLFACAEVFQRVHEMLASYTYRLPVRRFVHDLFDKTGVDLNLFKNLERSKRGVLFAPDSTLHPEMLLPDDEEDDEEDMFLPDIRLDRMRRRTPIRDDLEDDSEDELERDATPRGQGSVAKSVVIPRGPAVNDRTMSRDSEDLESDEELEAMQAEARRLLALQKTQQLAQTDNTQAPATARQE
eukprot:GILK01008403.1.p1 GENE.GILK01008403.1~~GILK01008403.1.p1  ORF type:complete len:1354 (+),score=260.34 GILK01008403.1:95-4156(+)